MIYLVLGCHKSGTTLVSEMLHSSGIQMIDDAGAVEETAGQSGYDDGRFYERSEWVRLNADILGYRTPVEDHPAPRSLLARDTTLREIQRVVDERVERGGGTGGSRIPVCVSPIRSGARRCPSTL